MGSSSREGSRTADQLSTIAAQKQIYTAWDRKGFPLQGILLIMNTACAYYVCKRGVRPHDVAHRQFTKESETDVDAGLLRKARPNLAHLHGAVARGRRLEAH
eukprot:Mycagemm_TRINITY_DN10295_c2_g2::TRINITY_DN10295_c2_g2_i2::g.4094::m.4094 type:complete len:102 gc:universal TRINITY_DN10295_c2_g2_i2:1024-719(-)